MNRVRSLVSGGNGRESGIACRVRRPLRLQRESLESRQPLAAIVAELGGPDAEKTAWDVLLVVNYLNQPLGLGSSWSG